MSRKVSETRVDGVPRHVLKISSRRATAIDWSSTYFEKGIRRCGRRGYGGALPAVVGGYLSVPIFAIPTSVGYGANFGGLSAASMLNTCIEVMVNGDSGFRWLPGGIGR